MNIYTHTPDGNEPDNNVLPEGSIGVRSNQLVIGDGSSTMSELDPVAGPEYGQGGSTSFVIASAEVDLSVAGTTELTYGTGFNGQNHIAQALYIEAANGTDTYTASANEFLDAINFNSVNVIEMFNFLFNVGFTDLYPIYGSRIYKEYIFPPSVGYTSLMTAISTAQTTDKWSIVIGATPPSSTQFRVTVKILGIKTA